jgi:hypothetical protein
MTCVSDPMPVTSYIMPVLIVLQLESKLNSSNQFRYATAVLSTASLAAA